MRLECITAPGTFTGVRGEKFVKAKQNMSKLVLSKNRSLVKRLFKTLKHLKMVATETFWTALFSPCKRINHSRKYHNIP